MPGSSWRARAPTGLELQNHLQALKEKSNSDSNAHARRMASGRRRRQAAAGRGPASLASYELTVAHREAKLSEAIVRLGDADAQPDPSTCKNDCVNCCTDCDYDDIAPPDDTAYYSQPGSYYAPQ